MNLERKIVVAGKVLLKISPTFLAAKSKEDKQQAGERQQMGTRVTVLLNLHNQKIRDARNELGEYIIYAKITSAKTLTVNASTEHDTSFNTAFGEVRIPVGGIKDGLQRPYVVTEVLGLTVYDYLRLIIELVEKHGFEIAPEGMLEFVREWSQFQLSE